MINKAQKLFVVLWLLFAVYAFADAVYHILVLQDTKKGLIYFGVSVVAYFMHRVRKKQYQGQ